MTSCHVSIRLLLEVNHQLKVNKYKSTMKLILFLLILEDQPLGKFRTIQAAVGNLSPPYAQAFFPPPPSEVTRLTEVCIFSFGK
jgi:hypothetical protein